MTGTISNPAFSYFNPLFWSSIFFENFADAMVFYEIQLRILGSIGLYILLRKNQYLVATSVVAVILFQFNGILPARGTDPQYALGYFALPLVFLALESIIEKFDLRSVLLFSLALSFLFLISIIHVYSFYTLYIILPYCLLRFPICKHKGKVFACIILSIFIHLLHVSFALFPILSDSFRSSKLIAGAGYDNQIYDYIRMSITLIMVSQIIMLALRSKIRFDRIFIKFGMILVLFLSLEKISPLGIRHLFSELYTTSVTMNDFVWEEQPVRWVFTGLQGMMIIYFVSALTKSKITYNQKFSHIALAFAYLGITAFWGGSLLFGLPETGVIPKINRTYYVPILGLIFIISEVFDKIFQYKFNSVKWPSLQKKLQIVTVVIACIFIFEAGYIFYLRTLFSPCLQYTMELTDEAKFIRKLEPTDRVCDVYENEHDQWTGNWPVHKDIIMRYTFPIYHGARTFTTVGLPIKSELAYGFHQKAIPLYFGTDEKEPTTNLVDMAGVNYIVSAEYQSHDYVELKLDGNDYKIYHNQKAWPRVVLFGDIKFLPQEALLDTLEENVNYENRFDFAYLAESDRAELNTEKNSLPHLDGDKNINFAPHYFESQRGKAEIIEYKDEEINIQCDIKEKSLLLLTDTYDSGWMARIDGEDIPVFRTNYAFRGVILPKGKYILKMNYEKFYRKPTLFVSLFTFILTIIVVCRKKSKNA